MACKNCKCSNNEIEVIVKFSSELLADEFVSWFEGSGEQTFGDHLDIVGMEPLLPKTDYKTRTITYTE